MFFFIVLAPGYDWRRHLGLFVRSGPLNSLFGVLNTFCVIPSFTYQFLDETDNPKREQLRLA